MKINFMVYKKENFEDLKRCMEKLQDFLARIDPLKRLRRLPNYGYEYTNKLVNKILKQDGLIILAYDKEKIIGCIAGVIEKQNKEDLLECVPTKPGRVLDLFVLDSHRGFGVGKKLMKSMEDYFKNKKCTAVRVEVFSPNEKTHEFYKRLNYKDRTTDMIRILKK